MIERSRVSGIEHRSRGSHEIAAALFLCMFASQASVLVLSPILTDVAQRFGVSTAVAGQLRALSGGAAGIVALLAGRLGGNLGLRRLVVAGLVTLVAGAIASSLAPTFAMLALAQVAIGFGLAAVLSGAVAAAGEWPSVRARAAVLSWTLNGQPSAWVVGLPLIGVVAGVSWRLTWIVVPLGSAVLALIAVRRLPAAYTPMRSRTGEGVARVLREAEVARWAVGELLAYSAWSGTLVFAGALFADSYGATPALTGLLLGGAALAYVPGNVLARRTVDGGSAGPLGILALAVAAGVLVFGVVRPSMVTSASVFALLAFLNGARGFAGSIRGMVLAPEQKVAVMSARAAATQFGYLLGSSLGGVALAAGGYPGLAAMLASLLALAALPHLVRRVPSLTQPSLVDTSRPRASA